MKIFYHSSDLDGRACGAILSRKYPEAEIFAYSYWYKPETSIDLIAPGEAVIFADITPTMPNLKRVLELTSDITIIDHHETSLNDLIEEGLLDKIKGIQTRDGIGACALVWQWCTANCSPEKQKIPLGIQCIAEYDGWQRTEANIHFQFGIQTFNTFPSNWIWDKLITDDMNLTSSIMIRGKHVWQYTSQWYRQVVRSYAIRGHVTHNGVRYSAVFINQGRVDSAIFDSLEEKYDLYIRGTFGKSRRWTISITTDRDDINVGLIAKDYEGGGHQKSAGMIVNELADFFEFIIEDSERYAQLPKADETHP